MNIGIFDSGRGGRFVAAKLRGLLPDHHYRVIDDRTHAPYGERSYDEIRQLTLAAIQPLLDCDIVVLACNTATAAAIDDLRRKYPTKTFVGFEPMIRPASQISRTKHVTLLATHATEYSERTEQLIAAHAPGFQIDRINTPDWAHKIDHDAADQITLDDVVESVTNGSDAIIIGCTHYIALMPRLTKLFPAINILEPTEAVAERIKTLVTALQPPQ